MNLLLPVIMFTIRMEDKSVAFIAFFLSQPDTHRCTLYFYSKISVLVNIT